MQRRTKVRWDRITALLVSAGVTGVALLGGLGTFGSVSSAAGTGSGGSDIAQAGSANRPATGTGTRDVAQRERLTGTGLSSPSASPSASASASASASPRSASDPDGSEVDAALPAGSGTGRRVVFDMSDQRVWLVDGSGAVTRSYLVSGSLTDNLDPGSYKVYSRSRNAVGVDDSGTMEYFVRFTRGQNAAIGFHDIPVKDGRPLQTQAQLGTPRSHGCIRQAEPDAIRMWDFAPIGTSVRVVA